MDPFPLQAPRSQPWTPGRWLQSGTNSGVLGAGDGPADWQAPCVPCRGSVKREARGWLARLVGWDGKQESSASERGARGPEEEKKRKTRPSVWRWRKGIWVGECLGSGHRVRLPNGNGMLRPLLCGIPRLWTNLSATQATASGFWGRAPHTPCCCLPLKLARIWC